ncbi:MAG: hypothetical protein LLG06_08795 [Desulfobacteraceae bacterium]|nr:hypothetical protein [Desulfobacteraceae bacterium]
MDEKTELLVCMAAATAANCVPCFEYYFKKASGIGVQAEEVKKTVELACKVKTGAGIMMKNFIEDITDPDGKTDRSTGKTAEHPCCR